MCVGVYPLWEGRHTSGRTFKAIFLDLAGKRKPALHGRAPVAETAEVEESQDEKAAENKNPVNVS
jgi:hypothetical protein